MLKPRATLSPIKGTDLFSSDNVTGQVLTSSPIMKSLHISLSPPHKQVGSHSIIRATILSSFLNQQQPSIPDERWRFVHNGHTNETVRIWMIAACPKQWPADLTKTKCEQPYNLSDENLNDMIPVSDQKKNQLQKSVLREVRWGKSERPRALRTWYNLRCDSVHHATTLVLMLWNSCSNIVQRYSGKFEIDNVHDTVQQSILTARHLRLTITTAKVVITESYTMSLRERIIKTSFVPNVMKTSDGNLSVGQDRRFSVFMSVQSRFSFFFFFFGCFYFRMRGNLLKYIIKISISRLFWSDR